MTVSMEQKQQKKTDLLLLKKNMLKLIQLTTKKKRNRKKKPELIKLHCTNLTPDDPTLQSETFVFTAQNARYTTTKIDLWQK